MGDARALFEAIPVAVVMRDRGQHHPGLLDALFRCHYRFFFDGATYTFCEDDVILGGIVWLSDYKAVGISRAEAIADIELGGDRVWLNGEEQVLERTAYKDINTLRLGLVVYQQRGFIAQLPAGDYESVWISTYPGEPDATGTVHIHVLPRSLCG